ncbi:hypothetical protein GCM10022408_12080 [Hymenobacter fastidiosus]|uniref:T9SS type A sorting domain-containing protein n=2 Tax=Hymenobacter fastidiosus TaxID=486264 RepID=A0ABP7RUX2_9BACT
MSQSGLDYSAVKATATDAGGNVYLAGHFTGTVSFGTLALTSVGSEDIFVAKWNPVANIFVWAQRAGGSGYDAVGALVVSGTSVYVAGRFSGATAEFGASTLTNTSPNSSDAFVVKLEDQGFRSSFVWAQSAGGANSESVTAMAVSGSNLYVTGSFDSTGAKFGTTSLSPVGGVYSDLFVAKLTDAGSSGRFAWAERAGGIGQELARSVAVHGTSVFVAGEYRSPTAAFGSTTLINSSANNNDTDVFVTKLTDAGSSAGFTWTRSAGGRGQDGATAIAVDGTSVYVAGSFNSAQAGFGGLTLTNAGFGYNAFVVKLTDAGSAAGFTWAQPVGNGQHPAVAQALAVTGTGLYVAGNFWGSTRFGPTTLPGLGSADVFVAKLLDAGSTGSFAWARQGGGWDHDYAYTLTVSGSNVYVGGEYYSPTADFGTQTIANPTRHTAFLAYLDELSPLAAGPPAGWQGVSLFPNPARGRTTLRLPPVAGELTATLTVLDNLGRLVRTQPVSWPAAGTTAAVELTGLPPGLYQLRVYAGSRQVSRRLVVE